MSMVGFPLLLIPLAIFNIIVFLMPTVSFADPVLRLTLFSGAEWAVSLSDMLLALAILMLLFEVIKGARPGAKYLTDHLLSLIVFGCAAAEFLLWPRFASSTYLLLTMLALVDFLTGVALRARRGKPAAAGVTVVPKAVGKTPAAAPESRFEPTPEPSVPAATAVAESVLLEHPAPKVLHPDVLPEIAPEAAHADFRHLEVKPANVQPTELEPAEVINPVEAKPHEVEPAAVEPLEVEPAVAKTTEVEPAEVMAPEVMAPEVLAPEVKAPEAQPSEVGGSAVAHREVTADVPSPEGASPQPAGSASPPDKPAH